MDALRKHGFAPALSAGLLSFFCALCCLSQEPQSAIASQPQAPEAAAPSFRSSFMADLDATLQAIEAESPSFFKRFKPEDKARLTGTLLSTMRPGLEIVEPGSKPKSPASDAPETAASKGPSCPPGVMIASNKVFYLRLSALDSSSYPRLKEECESASRLANKPVGIVLDLRECGGSDHKDALDVLTLFSQGGAALVDVKPAASPFFDLPMAVLIGSRTSGSAEILAALIDRGRQGLTIGGSTAGRPFQFKTLKCGPYTLSMPMAPDSLGFLDALPVVPEIAVSPYSAIPYEKLASGSKSEESDKCLSRAVDLLVSLDAIKRKWKR